MKRFLRSALVAVGLGSVGLLAFAHEPESELPPPPVPEIVVLPEIPIAPPTVLPEIPKASTLPDIPIAPPVPDEDPDAKPTWLPPVTDDPVSAKPADTSPALAPAPRPAPVSEPPTGGLGEAVYDPVWREIPLDGNVWAYGLLSGGFVYNTSNPDSKFNGPYNSIDRSAEPMFNQGYFVLERRLRGDASINVGWRLDALFGYDHFLGQSRGFEVDRDAGKRWNGQYYGLAIPQAYVEAGNDVMTLKLGHFYTLVGYEVLPATGNFFYSHAYSYQFGQPFTHWGGLITTQLTGNWQVQVGLANAWDTLVGRVNSVNFLGGLKYIPDGERWWASFALASGRHQNNVAGLPNIADSPGNRTRYGLLLGVTPGGPCGKWEYIFHHYYGWQENGTPQGNFARWYGIDQYLFYRLTQKVKLGGRFEWFRDEDGTRVGLNRPSNPNKPPLPGNYFSLTGGINYLPMPNLIVRPEVRWDFTSDTIRRAFNDGAKNNQLLFAFDAIWQF
ncbi:MAG: outer membrane beta-barrel protein [Planctomycetia bacterium]|nr:outer membrane beta-barrel protein [Planctomycetia bacterium]